MKTLIQTSSSMSRTFSKGFFLSMCFFLLYGSSAIADEGAGNTTMKAVFAEVKTELKNNELFSTLLMIGGVIMIVVFAMWLSFRTPEGKAKA